MIIHNLRYGFATNSSSSHSIVFMEGAKDELEDDYNVFGWEAFTLASKEAKKRYAVATLAENLSFFSESKDWKESEKEIADKLAMWTGMQFSTIPYIDHQSVITLPADWYGKALDREFYDAFEAELLLDDVVVLGGNDNGGHHPMSDIASSEGASSVFSILDREASPLHYVARRDKSGSWTLFNRRTGKKQRFSFHGGPATFTKASAPELVDLKITNYCQFGCAYCYQESTPQGQHADSKTVLEPIADALERMRVFEVAIGGGEPTMHPEFLSILKMFKARGVTPNFTTKSVSWLKQPWAKEAVDTCGGVAFSVDSASDVKRFADALENVGFAKIDPVKFHVQHVMGMADEREFERIAQAAMMYGFTLTLLGYKRVGRGKSLTVKGYDWWLDVLKTKRYLRSVGIDTALAADYKQQILDAGISENMFETQEGGFSMYIDAVEQTLARSSYHEESRTRFERSSRLDDVISTAFASW